MPQPSKTPSKGTPVKGIIKPSVQVGSKSPLALHVGGQSSSTVSVAVGKTFNIGDYETIRVDVARTYPVGTGASFDRVQDECVRDTVAAFKITAEAVLASLQE